MWGAAGRGGHLAARAQGEGGRRCLCQRQQLTPRAACRPSLSNNNNLSFRSSSSLSASPLSLVWGVACADAERARRRECGGEARAGSDAGGEPLEAFEVAGAAHQAAAEHLCSHRAHPTQHTSPHSTCHCSADSRNWLAGGVCSAVHARGLTSRSRASTASSTPRSPPSSPIPADPCPARTHTHTHAKSTLPPATHTQSTPAGHTHATATQPAPQKSRAHPCVPCPSAAKREERAG
eukprot:3328595-Rhodomonas_salina.1